jgi:hypothetical protein
MNAFKQKSLYAAVAGVAALGAAGTANAVHINDDRLGQVLLYPYYTVRNNPNALAYDTLFTVLNTTATVKAVKVRFLEGRNSREVLDFNLFLSPRDVFAARVSRTADGAAIYSNDQSCLVGNSAATLMGSGVVFCNLVYAGMNVDNGGQDLDRGREGYFEVIEMAEFSSTVPADATNVAVNATHSNGVAKCASITDTLATEQALPPKGGLTGGAYLINVAEGTAYTMDPTALDAFFDGSVGRALARPTPVTKTNLYELSGTIYPNLGDVNPKTSIVTSTTLGAANAVNADIFVSQWPASIAEGGTRTIPASTTAQPLGNPDPVSAVLMRDTVINEYFTASSVGGGTDWVVTNPTKFFYAAGTDTAARLPYQSAFASPGVSCDDVTISSYYNRDEGSATVTNDVFSPPPVATSVQFCHEVNVFTFNNSNVFGSKLGSVASGGGFSALGITTGTFVDGWLPVSFPNTSVGGVNVHRLVSTTGSRLTIASDGTLNNYGGANQVLTYNGLPVVGLSVIRAGTTGGVTAAQNYGANFEHKFTRRVQ